MKKIDFQFEWVKLFFFFVVVVVVDMDLMMWGRGYQDPTYFLIMKVIDEWIKKLWVPPKKQIGVGPPHRNLSSGSGGGPLTKRRKHHYDNDASFIKSGGPLISLWWWSNAITWDQIHRCGGGINEASNIVLYVYFISKKPSEKNQIQANESIKQ